MSTNSLDVALDGGPARVLILSQRNVNLKVFQCYIYEFEDVISAVDSAEIVAPRSSVTSEPGLLALRTLNRGRRIAGLLPRSEIRRVLVEREYDLFFAVFQFPYQIEMLDRVKGWRSKCKKAVCLVNEIWTKDIPRWKRHLRKLSQFDEIFVPTSVSVDPLSRVLGRRCRRIAPFAVDMDRFCPSPVMPERVIDILSIGRYSPPLHKELLQMAETDQIFYYYDSVHNFSVHNWQDHRSKYANMLRRSRFFLTYNLSLNKLDITGGDEALMPRLFEGAAAGTVLLGIPPTCPEYLECFPWKDSMLPLSYKPKHLPGILAELDAEPQRLAQVRRDNVVNSLQRHDWVYRWSTILDAVQLPHTRAMDKRKGELSARAELCSSSDDWIAAEKLIARKRAGTRPGYCLRQATDV